MLRLVVESLLISSFSGLQKFEVSVAVVREVQNSL